MDSSNLNVNTPNAALLRRGSAISMSNEINMNNLAGKLQQIRRKSTASMFSSGNESDFTSSDSESDVEENARRLSGKSSVYSMLSRKSQRRNSKDAQEYDTADFDLTQVILKCSFFHLRICSSGNWLFKFIWTRSRDIQKNRCGLAIYSFDTISYRSVYKKIFKNEKKFSIFLCNAW